MGLLNLVVDIVKIVPAVAKDVVTMGGALVDEDSQTMKQIKKIDEDIFGK